MAEVKLMPYEDLLTPEFLNRLKERDPRLHDLDLRLKIEKELRDSLALQVIIEAAGEQAAEALEALAEVDPTDTNLIVRLQACVTRARYMRRTLNAVIKRGEAAENSLLDDNTYNVEDGER